ncbi:MAG: hypothetical protein JHD16_04335 [Solirubrobacteraceae bacterium]|nr:hypothetical protein [Solirubrobacteraceae bacterium]
MDARRMRIADAALSVIAGAGIRGLTHRAVDAEAELPAGSTSYYCRKRVDLLQLTLVRLYDLDSADIAAVTQRLVDGPSHAAAIKREIAQLVVQWLTPPDRARTIARFELFLAASHEPALQALLQEQLAGIVGLTEVLTPAIAEPPRPEQRLAILMLAEGLMLSNVRQGLQAPALADVERLLSTLEPSST